MGWAVSRQLQQRPSNDADRTVAKNNGTNMEGPNMLLDWTGTGLPAGIRTQCDLQLFARKSSKNLQGQRYYSERNCKSGDKTKNSIKRPRYLSEDTKDLIHHRIIEEIAVLKYNVAVINCMTMGLSTPRELVRSPFSGQRPRPCCVVRKSVADSLSPHLP